MTKQPGTAHFNNTLNGVFSTGWLPSKITLFTVLPDRKGSRCFASPKRGHRMKSQGIFTLMNEREFTAWLQEVRVQRKVDRIQNHHTWLPNYAQFNGDNHFAKLEGMRAYHMQRNKWSNIGQNLTTFPDGTVAVCRPLDVVPAGITMSNTGAICIEHLGDFDAGKDSMTDAHKDIIIAVNALLCRRFGFTVPSVRNIVYHHWYEPGTGRRTGGSPNSKTCPGTAFFGGNTEAACEADLLPLVKAKLSALVTQPAPAALVSLGKGRVTATWLNVRARPSTNGAVLRRMPKGQEVQWYARANSEPLDWLRIHPTADEWVAASFISSTTNP